VISEIMYNPPTGPEYVELVNITDSPVELYDPSYPANTWELGSAIDFVFPPSQVVPPHGVVLISGMTEASLRAAIPDLGDAQVFGPWTGALDNKGESVILYRPGDPELNGDVPLIQVDRLDYADDAPWPLGPDGAGTSLERFALALYGNDPSYWSPSATTGGTPGTIQHPPTQVILFTTGLKDGTGRIIWEALPGHEYIVQYCTDLDGPWFTLETITPTTAIAEVIDPNFLTTKQRFYRIHWVRW
jgi:hypothetical protein